MQSRLNWAAQSWDHSGHSMLFPIVLPFLLPAEWPSGPKLQYASAAHIRGVSDEKYVPRMTSLPFATGPTV